MRNVPAPSSLPLLLAPVLLALAACGAQTSGTPQEEMNDGPAACDPAVYPCGPYGYSPGSVLRNLSLVGRRDTNRSGSAVDDAAREVKLSEYFAEKDKVRVLVLLASAEWCVPCQQEQPLLVALYNKYQSEGGHVAMLEAIVEDKDHQPSYIEVADRWATRFGLQFDIAVDPSQALSPYYDVNAFPMQMVVRTSDMNIIWQSNGIDEEGLKIAIAQAVRQ